MSIRAQEIDRQGDVFLLVRTRSILACILHWVIFCAVVTLVITGFYIANPAFYYGQGEAWQAFAMANMRKIHFVAATFLLASVLLRFYLAFTKSCNKDILQFAPTAKNIANAVKLVLHYVTGKGEDAHYRFINPLGGLGIFLMVLSIGILILTGFMMYLPGSTPDTLFYNLSQTVTGMLGGLQWVRVIHQLTMYFLIFLVIIHVYMQIWKNIIYTESDISSIIAGYKLFPYKYYGQFADYYGLDIQEPPPSEEEMRRASHEQPEKYEDEA